MQPGSRQSFAVATLLPGARDLRVELARLGFLAAVFAGMVAFAATGHGHKAAVLESPVAGQAR
jgi:hypothetical protein